MKILQVTAPAEFQILDVPTPVPGPGQVLMRVEAVNTCVQWDLHLRHNEPMFIGHQFTYPYTPGQPGHEATGTIEAVGPQVTELQPGDRVCSWRDQGHHVWGCYAQYVILEAANALPIPAGLGPEYWASLELAMCLGTPMRNLREVGAIAGKRFGVMGLGPAGVIAAQMAKAEGAREVVGFDLIPERREFARHHGCDLCLDPHGGAPGDFPARATVQAAIECNGARESVQWLLDHTAETVALFGVQRQDYTYEPRHAGLTVLGYKGHFRAAAEYSRELVASGRLDMSPLATLQLPLERYNEGIELLEQRRAWKVLFQPWA